MAYQLKICGFSLEEYTMDKIFGKYLLREGKIREGEKSCQE